MHLLIFLLLGLTQTEEVTKDENRIISIVSVGEEFEVLPGKSMLESVVAWASFTDDQTDNGWMYLEISTNQEFPDQVQAKAAGFAEGYLTRNTIHEYFKEFYTKDICAGEEGKEICEYFRKQILVNDVWIKEQVEKKAHVDPYWHMINMFYQQMDGMMEGWKLKTFEQGTDLPDDFDTEYGVKLINYLADMFDYMEKYKNAMEKKTLKKMSKPTSSVLIKHLPDRGEVYVGHNTWHEYRAMSTGS